MLGIFLAVTSKHVAASTAADLTVAGNVVAGTCAVAAEHVSKCW